MTSKEALLELRLKQPPATGQESNQYLTSVWQQKYMCTFKDFLRWSNNKDVVPTLEVMQKMVDFYHSKGIDMLKLGCTLPNLANIFLHKSTTARCYPFTEIDKHLLDKIHEDMFGGPSIIFTGKVVVDGNFARDSTNLCKSTVGIDANQLYAFSMC